MFKIGLTGSIGMGKSTVCNFFNNLGVKVWSADEAVHEIYKKNGIAVKPILEHFPNVSDENNGIDRQKLSKLIIENPALIAQLEKIVHPLVKSHRDQFAKNNKNEKYIIFDVPLLFETNAQSEFDKIIVVDCRPETQKQRVLARAGMTIEKFETIIKRQMPNFEKTAKADIIIDTDRPLSEVESQIRNIHFNLINETNA